jgi:tRNA A37 threonylcarbamoyladenosine synthetase subunit TsaC/SUA5/YrdC
VVATSANLAGEPPAVTAAEVRRQLGCLVLDGGATPGGAPSTLVRVRGDVVEVLRAGAIRLETG